MCFNAWRAHRLPTAALFSLVLFAGCSRPSQPAIQRLAILRFENLTPDPATDWMGRAFAEVITAELAGAANLYAIPTSRMHRLNPVMGARPVAAPGISAEAPLAVALGATRIGYGEYAIVNGRIRGRLTIEDLQGRRVSQGPFEAAADAADVVGAATALTRQVSGNAQPYGTHNPAALEAYAKAMESPDAAAIAGYAGQAIAADPNFGAVYVMLAELKINQQDRAGAMALLEAAAARGTAIPQTDRIHLEILAATLRSDQAALSRALSAQAQAAPFDPVAWRSLAEASLYRRQFPQAVQFYQRALTIEPEDINTWNQLGYSAAYAGNLDAAMSALRRYQALRPADANALDSMGDVNLLTGHLPEAERLYLEAHRKAPALLNGADLHKAAMARLMTGDVAGADGILQGAGGAEWLWAKGRRQEAYAKLAAAVQGLSNRDLQSRGYAELAMWSMLLGDRDAAARMAQLAAALATPATVATVAVARFASMPATSATDWAVRAQQFFPNAPPNSVKDVALAYALLLNGHFEAAAALLKQLEEHNPPSPERGTDIQLAWALIETGNFKEAAPLLRLNPVPSTTGPGLFFGLHFPRLYQLRAIVADKEGKAEEARENRRIYAALGGT